MGAPADAAVVALTERYFTTFPHEAARQLEALPAQEIGDLLQSYPVRASVRAWQRLAPDIARSVIEAVDAAYARELLSQSAPSMAASVLARALAIRRPDSSRAPTHTRECRWARRKVSSEVVVFQYS